MPVLVSLASPSRGDDAMPSAKSPTLPKTVFRVEGRDAFVIYPPRFQDENIPWVWYAPALPQYPAEEEKWMFQRFSDAGIAIAGIDVGESYGSPAGVKLFSSFYAEMTEHRHFSNKPCLLARSRGGLMIYNWAADHPDCISGIAGIYPVGDLRSYPGLKKAAEAYGMTEAELAKLLSTYNPVDRLAPLASSHVPIFHIHGDGDQIVPLSANSGEIAKRYQELGGTMTLKVIHGEGHSLGLGFFHCQQLVDFVVSVIAATQAEQSSGDMPWATKSPNDPTDVTLNGVLGDDLNRAIGRLAKLPYTLAWLRSDLSYEMPRPFTNFSGDVSGRFLEVATLTSPPGQEKPSTLPAMLSSVSNYQRTDGHFGADVDWRSFDQVMTKGTPILWGNARMLIGLVAAYQRYNDPKILETATKLGDFYVNTSTIFCDPQNQQSYHNATNYFSGFDTCYFPAMESLVDLYQQTKDDRYLKLAKKMANLFYDWDRLPFPHTHGNLCSQYGLLLLYETTGDTAYLKHVEAKWNEACKGGYVWPTGGVGENFTVNSARDEGCAESDWLRVNLRLWADTGDVKYLDMADREIHNEYQANQFPNGGFGNRFIESDAKGAYALGKDSEEATWCCVFHGTVGLFRLKSYLVVGAQDGIYLNFPLDFSATVTSGGKPWKFVSSPVDPASPNQLSLKVHLEPPSPDSEASIPLRIRVPDWATAVTALDAAGKSVSLDPMGNRLVTTGPIKGSTDLVIQYSKQIRVEDRELNLVSYPLDSVSTLHDVILRDGPNVLYANEPSGRDMLLATLDASGHLQLASDGAGHFTAVKLPPGSSTREEAAAAATTGSPVTLGSFASLPPSDRKLFVFDLLVVPRP